VSVKRYTDNVLHVLALPALLFATHGLPIADAIEVRDTVEVPDERLG
jgi:hypothetical protein